MNLQEIYDAELRLKGTTHLTSLEHSDTFSKMSDAQIWLKCENQKRPVLLKCAEPTTK